MPDWLYDLNVWYLTWWHDHPLVFWSVLAAVAVIAFWGVIARTK